MNRKNILWGILLIALGLIFGCNALGLTDIDLFFDGWWTLFIIIPCLFGLIEDKDKTGSLIGLGVGVAFLLACQGVLNFELIWKLAFPVILIILGLRLVFKTAFRGQAARNFAREHRDDPAMPEYCATFSSQNLNFRSQPFHGARLSAVFGGIKCDLTGAALDQDVLIDAEAIFGGVEIIVPSHIQVKLSSNACFGGVKEENPHSTVPGAVTVYINAAALFGGVTVK